MGCGGRGSVESGPDTLHRGRPVGCPGTNATTVDPPAGWRRSGVGSRAERVGVSPGSFAGCSRDSAGAFAALRRAVGNGGERLPIRHGLPVPPGPGRPVVTGTGPEFGGPICSFPGVVQPAEPGSPGTRVPAHLRPWPVPGLTRRAALRWTMCGSNPIRNSLADPPCLRQSGLRCASGWRIWRREPARRYPGGLPHGIPHQAAALLERCRHIAEFWRKHLGYTHGALRHEPQTSTQAMLDGSLALSVANFLASQFEITSLHLPSRPGYCSSSIARSSSE